MVNITFGQYQEGSVDGYNNVCKVLFFLWLADTSLSFVCSFVSLKIQTMFEMVYHQGKWYLPPEPGTAPF